MLAQRAILGHSHSLIDHEKLVELIAALSAKRRSAPSASVGCRI
jgi:hypothetical protein